MKIPKNDFSIGIYSHKSRRDRFHARILALERENGCLEMEEAECLYTPVNEICNTKNLVHYAGEKEIEAYLKKRKQRIPPFRVFLQTGKGELCFQSETHFKKGRKERRIHFRPGENQSLETMKQLHTLSDEITGDTATSGQLSAMEQLAMAFGGKYEIKITLSKGFVRHYEGAGDANALTLWNEIWNLLHGKHYALDNWPCRRDTYFEFQLTNVSSKLSYHLTMDTKLGRWAGEKRWLRELNFNERIFDINDWNSPIFQDEDDDDALELGVLNLSAKLTSCHHPFMKEILALPSVSMESKPQ